MPTTDARRHTIPLGSDQARRQSLLDLSLSISDIRGVSSQADADQYVASLGPAGAYVDSLHPVYVWRADREEIQIWTGDRWVIVPSQTRLTAKMFTPAPTWDITLKSGTRTGLQVSVLLLLVLTEEWHIQEGRTYTAGHFFAPLASTTGTRTTLPTVGPSVFMDVDGSTLKVTATKATSLPAGRYWPRLVWDLDD